MKGKRKKKVVANVVVGKPDIEPDAPSHVPGVYQGNRAHFMQRDKGIKDLGPTRAVANARRSTGIRAKHHDVIDPRMPKISPA